MNRVFLGGEECRLCLGLAGPKKSDGTLHGKGTSEIYCSEVFLLSAAG